MNAAAIQSLILFGLIAVGFVAGRLKTIGQESAVSLSRFLVHFTLPALIIVSMQQPFSPDLRNQAFQVLGFSTLVYASAFALAWLLTLSYRHSSARELGVHRFAMCFSNVGFMGFPVAEAILGRESLFIVSIYNIPFQILAFSVGILMIAGRHPAARPQDGNTVAAGTTGTTHSATAGSNSSKRSLGRLLLNPSILSAIIGFFLFLFSIQLPGPLFSILDILGGTTTPLAMVLIGVQLAHSGSARILLRPTLWVTGTYRLLIHPLLVFALARLFGLSGLNLAVPVLIAAMPVAANSSILAAAYGGDSELAGGLVFATTLLSLATIPLISLLF
ncbi:MAG: AEC family transporter [Spirochaetes bacterium]|nr:AEC family transporter [Spirochaetota bacterium]